MFSIESVERVQKSVIVPINKNDGHIDVEVKISHHIFNSSLRL